MEWNWTVLLILYSYTINILSNMPKKDQQGYYGFDPSGLERAATVIPTINLI